MARTCSVAGCQAPVPDELEEARLCVLHFTLRLEDACTELRRETSSGAPDVHRRAEIASYVSQHGEKLARVATSGLLLSDAMKARILSTFLTLMNLRESVNRAAAREPASRKLAT
jgi:hypothetical protein